MRPRVFSLLDHGADWASRMGDWVARPFARLEGYCNRRWHDEQRRRREAGGQRQGPCLQCADTAGGFRCHDCDHTAVTVDGPSEDDIDVQALMRRRDRLAAAYDELMGDDAALGDEDEREHRTKLLAAVEFLSAEFGATAPRPPQGEYPKGAGATLYECSMCRALRLLEGEACPNGCTEQWRDARMVPVRLVPATGDYGTGSEAAQ